MVYATSVESMDDPKRITRIEGQKINVATLHIVWASLKSLSIYLESIDRDHIEKQLNK